MRPGILGMVLISISVFFLILSFIMQTIPLFSMEIPSAGISIIFVVLATIFFEYGEKSDVKRQEEVNEEVVKTMDTLSSAISSGIKKGKEESAGIKKDMSSLASETKKQDKILAADIKKQEKSLTSSIKKQGKVNVEFKKKITYLSSDLKKHEKSESEMKKATGEPPGKPQKKAKTGN